MLAVLIACQRTIAVTAAMDFLSVPCGLRMIRDLCSFSTSKSAVTSRRSALDLVDLVNFLMRISLIILIVRNY